MEPFAIAVRAFASFEAGKQKTSPLIVGMRKLLTILNAMMRTNTLLMGSRRIARVRAHLSRNRFARGIGDPQRSSRTRVDQRHSDPAHRTIAVCA